MFLRSVLKCAIVLSVTRHDFVRCNLDVNNSQPLSNGSQAYTPFPSLIRDDGRKITLGENVTPSDTSGSLDKRRFDKREFPSSARHKRNFDTPYHDIDYYDYEIIPAAAEELPECILSRSEFYLSWWVNENGSLRLPASNREGNGAGFADLSVKFRSEDAIFEHVSKMTTDNPHDIITFMSIANNELAALPFETLKLVSVSLQYLSLANNNFHLIFVERNKTFQAWSAFPLMNSLKELDLRNCSLTSLDYDLFKNLPNLEKLFLSHNLLTTVPSSTFSDLRHLSHLDLSYNLEETPNSFNFDPFSFYLQGLMLEENVFAGLTNLLFLDLSFSKLRQESLRALSELRGKVEQLSLCYTDIPLIAPRMFSETNLKVLDLSGNPSLLPGLTQSWFGGLEQKMEILVFKNSNIKSLAPLRNLKKLRMLDVGNNNINPIHPTNFANFADLEILDLNSNHISNWYERVFEKNEGLKIINLRSNNINLMTPQMMNDFSQIRFLAIGANNFVCDCTLRDFIDRATFNAMLYQCSNTRRVKRSAFEEGFFEPQYHYDVFLREFHYYVRLIDESYNNIVGNQNSVERTFKTDQKQFSVPTETVNCEDVNQDNLSSESVMKNFNFLLLDYNENDYHCIDSDGMSKRKVLFSDIDPCPDRNVPSTEGSTLGLSTDGDGYESDDVEKPEDKFYTPNTLLIIYISVGIPISLLGVIWFWKRRDIKYFCAILKNTFILSLDNDDKKTLMMKNRRRKSNTKDDHYNYDVFVSYSDKDRQWVLDQLIPNLEKRSEITICLHERDFQVGASILENIIHSMDQSRCLLLVISESFLESNWCVFELHMAQHRLIETRREQLILVLLQDISKAKRPRTLTFLMRTKTYIIWPIEDKAELRNIFWKRLKKAIVLNNWEPEKSKPKPRHSIV